MANIYVDSNVVGGLGDGSSWANAYATLLAALAEPDGTDYLCEYRHVENNTTAASVSWDFSTTKTSRDTCISVDKDNSDAYRKGAVIDHNINAQILAVGGHITAYGMRFDVGNGGSNFATDMHICDNAEDAQVYIDCDFHVDNHGNAGIMAFGDSDTKCTLYNCNISFADDAYVQIFDCDFKWYGGTYTSLDVPADQLFVPVVDTARVYCEGVDFSDMGSDVHIMASSSGTFISCHLRNCKLPSSWTGSLITGTVDQTSEVTLENCGSSDVNYTYAKENRAGTVDHQTDLYPSGTVGGKHNTADVPLSLKMIGSTEADPQHQPLFSPPIVKFNEDTTSLTWTWEFIHNDGALLQDNDVWMQIAYLATSGQQQSTNDDTAFDDKFGTFDPYATPANITTSTKAWDEGLTERANSTVYAAGDIVKASGSPGLAFIVPAGGGGTSAASPPAGFTGASDGDSITDGTVTWNAMRRQKVQLTITAAEQGLFKANLVLAKPSTTIYGSALLEAA